MKSMKNLALAGSVALMAATSVCAQNTSSVVPDHRPLDTRPLATDRDYDRAGEGLTKANKASGLMGMDVRNMQNEKLGDIKDLVVDLHSGRIAYAVMSVGGFLGIGDKYIAVPPSEFKLSADGKELILNADKTRLENAPGFAKNNWPDLNNPSWRTHSSYWLPDGTAAGTVGTIHTGRDTGGTVHNSDLGTFTGKITGIDAAAKTINVESASGRHVFRLDNRATVSLKNDSHARLEDLHVGDRVTVGYHEHNGSMIVDSISDTQRSDR